jgi:hypothetical protein
VALEREIDKVGFPYENHEPGWRTIADVVRWIEVRPKDDEPGKTALKDNVGAMLKRIKAKKDGK